MRTTYMAKPGEVDRKWYIVDAKGIALGRLASTVASILRGKNKPTFTPHVDTGDFVIVVNAADVKLTGKKADRKMYYRHSNHPGGLKSRTAGDFLAKEPAKMVEQTIKGMLPHTPLGRKMGMKLHVYAGEDHKHEAQKPEKLDITNLI
ncbi:MAG TPA: 50S ribosomal protein L13 [Candidatus Limosilactobacillus merdigallinarum]|uniref:Large ribosomal subunit protein uL13 n=1 Tax=Candidatus Limosilactobacillus merdigallinarum TaxID=2838652 RepID=A0A9D2AKI5_9LACO|nr:50S ribosomal protein L13 [Candidatus Limosilactobacillus merdigallinarum]